MRRDRVTFGMMVGIPLLQLILFGFAINADPKNLPVAVLLADRGPHGRTLLSALRNSSYFNFVHELESEQEARRALERGEVQFVIDVPQSFSRDLLRGEIRKSLEVQVTEWRAQELEVQLADLRRRVSELQTQLDALKQIEQDMADSQHSAEDIRQ